MNLPNAEGAIVERDKITGYLLNSGHPDNGGKAQFFLTAGFNLERWPELASALRRLALTFPVTKSVASRMEPSMFSTVS